MGNDETERSVVLQHALFGHHGVISFLAWEPHGRALISTSLDGTVRLWDSASGKQLKFLDSHEGGVLSAAWAPEGQAFVTAGSDRRIIIWDYPSGQKLDEITDIDRTVTSMSWSPSGKQVLTTTHDRRIYVWDIHNRRIKTILDGHRQYPRFTAFSPKGEYMASTSDGKKVRLWKGGSFSPGKVLEGHKATVNMVAWLSDDILGTASDDQTIRIWDVRKGTCLKVLTDHVQRVMALSFSSDGRLMASRSWDNTLRLWRCDNWESVAVMEEDTTSPFPSLAFQPRGVQLASVGLSDQVVRIWDLNMEHLSVESCALEVLPFRDQELTLLARFPEARELVCEPMSPQIIEPTTVVEDASQVLRFCGECGEAFPPDLIERRKSLGHNSINCSICDHQMALPGYDPLPQPKTLLEWAGSSHLVLTILFTDIVESTELGNRVGDPAMKIIRRDHFQRTRDLISEHGGYEIKTIGDAFMIAFRSANPGLQMALALRDDTGHREVRIRGGLHVGSVDIEENDAFGVMVNLCSRIEGSANPSEIRVSDEARHQIDEGGEPRSWISHENVSLKGFDETFQLWSI